MFSFWKKSTTAINKLVAEVTDVNWHNYAAGYRDVEFSFRGARYRLVSTGDLYRIDYTGMPTLVRAFQGKYKDEIVAVVAVVASTGYYTRTKKQYRLKDLVWAAFGDQDLPAKSSVICKNGNWKSCGIDNLEVRQWNTLKKK